MSQTGSIYGLYSSQDGMVRYVGQTTQSLNRRLHQHIADTKRKKAGVRCRRWIRKVLREGHEVHIRLLEDQCDLRESEIRWIATYRQRYPDKLTNIANGGSGGLAGVKRSLATRSKMSKPKSDAHRANMRKPKCAETKKLMSLAQIGNRKSIGEANRHAKLTRKDVIEIKRRLASGQGPTEIAAIYGVQKAAISKINVGRTWKHITAR